MSHVAEISLEIKDLDALAVSCRKLGLELKRGQEEYRWFGRSVGDYPLPKGFKKADLGKCDHAIIQPNNPQGYEIGVVKRRDGKPGYTLLWDSWNGGYGLQDKVGRNACLLKQRYGAEVAAKKARQQGFRVSEKVDSKGRLQLICQR